MKELYLGYLFVMVLLLRNFLESSLKVFWQDYLVVVLSIVVKQILLILIYLFLEIINSMLCLVAKEKILLLKLILINKLL